MSFLKQLPPNPGPEFKNFGPILLSNPIALETSLTSAPVASHKAPMELIELILCAKKALAVNLESSELQIFVFRILFLSIFKLLKKRYLSFTLNFSNE